MTRALRSAVVVGALLACMVQAAGQGPGGLLGGIDPAGGSGPQPATPGDDIRVAVDGAEADFKAVGEAPGAADLSVTLQHAGYFVLGEPEDITVVISRGRGGGPYFAPSTFVTFDVVSPTGADGVYLEVPPGSDAEQPDVGDCELIGPSRLECAVSSLRAGESIRSVLRIRVTEGQPDETVTIDAVVDAGVDSVPANNQSHAELTLLRDRPVDPDATVDLQIAIEGMEGPEAEGVIFLPEAIVTNIGTESTASNVRVVLSYEFVSSRLDGSAIAIDPDADVSMDAADMAANRCATSGRGYACILPRLGPGELRRVQLNVTVNSMATTVGQFEMTAHVFAYERDDNPDNNSVADATTVVTNKPTFRLANTVALADELLGVAETLPRGVPQQVTFQFAHHSGPAHISQFEPVRSPGLRDPSARRRCRCHAARPAHRARSAGSGIAHHDGIRRRKDVRVR
jgi:hypothetical protein